MVGYYGLEPEFIDGSRKRRWRVGSHDIPWPDGDDDMRRAIGLRLLGDPPSVDGRVALRWWLILYADANHTERVHQVCLR